VSRVERRFVPIHEKGFVVLWFNKPLPFLVTNVAPVQLCYPRNCCRIPQEAICVSTVDTANFLQEIQILQSVPINLNILPAINIRHPVQWETEPMVELNCQIQNEERYQRNPDNNANKCVADEGILLWGVHWVRHREESHRMMSS